MAYQITTNTSHAATDPRRRSNRRSRTSLWNRYHWFGGRRRYTRRAEDSNQYVDLYGTDVVLATLGLLLLSATDAFMTLNLLQNGAMELNPVMRVLIERNIAAFLWVKLGLTALSALILAIHHPFRLFGKIPVLHLLHLLVALYAMLVIYEMGLGIYL